MGTVRYGCGCYVTRSMFGEREVLSLGHCWQHWPLYSQHKSNAQMADEIRAIPDPQWREQPDNRGEGTYA